MNLSELISKYGDDKVSFQKIDECVSHLNMTKHGTSAKFVTSERFNLDGFQKLGLIVWLDRERVAAIVTEDKSAALSPPAVPGEVERENAKLVELIKTRFLGVHPDDLDCYLEYDDWTRIIGALSVPLPEIEGGDKGDGWQPADTAPKDGFFLAWSPDHPELVMTWKAELFHQARTPGTPRHLSANHFTLWMPIPLPGGANG